MKRAAAFISSLFCIVLLNSCKGYIEETNERGRKAEAHGRDIIIGVVESSPVTGDMVDGIRLAIEEYNAKGGFKGRKIRYIERDDMRETNKALKIANEFARNEDVIAVIGHMDSSTAIPASIVYEYSGIVNISTRAADPDLTQHGFEYVFRNIPTSRYITLWLAKYVYDKKYNEMVVIDDNTDYGRGLANFFQVFASDLGIKIKQWLAYDINRTDYRAVISEMMEGSKFNAVFIAGTHPAAAVFIRQAREMGVKVPFIIWASHSAELWEIAGESSEGVVTPAMFNYNDNSTKTREFVKHFKARFNRMPKEMAARGYDAVELIIYGFTKGNTTRPAVIAANIRFIENWDSVFGSYDMRENGDIGDIIIYFATMHDSRFELDDADKTETFAEVEKFFNEKIKDINKEKDR
ncbi:MAG: ABC transporter substrate-binding protein [Nitrospirae bacterium]|nr:ABC transporter substrate-binding protein [Nitrospirota bacterium]